ncbi:MAG: gamma-glutamyltransferase [Deltaproteobacteria bacterium]
MISPDAAAQEAGTNVLHGGGNAVDAVLAAMLAGATRASPASLLGSGVIIVAGAGVGAFWIDGRARVPGLGVRRAQASDDPPRAWSVALPGLLEGVLTAHNRFGRAGLGSLTRAAVTAAREHDGSDAVRARSKLVEMLPHSGLDALARLGIRQAILEGASPSVGGLITREDLATYLPSVEALAVLATGSQDVLMVPVPVPPRFAPPPPPDVPMGSAVAGDKEGVMACAVWAIADEAFALPGETGLSMAALSTSPTKGVTRRRPGSQVPLRVPAAILRSEGRPWGACVVSGEGEVDALCLRQVAARLEQAGIAFAAPAPGRARGVVSWVLSEPGGEWRGASEAHNIG